MDESTQGQGGQPQAENIPPHILTELQQLRAERDQRARDAERDKALQSAASGQLTQAIDQLRADADRREGELKSRLASQSRDMALATATLGVKFTNGEAARDALAKLADEFTTVEGPDGKIEVRHKKTGILASECAAKVLTENVDRYGHYIRAVPRIGPGPLSPPEMTPGMYTMPGMNPASDLEADLIRQGYPPDQARLNANILAQAKANMASGRQHIGLVP